RRRRRSRTTSSTTRATARRRSPRCAGSTRRSSPTSRRGGVRATKRRALGQHFLRDAGVACAIVDLLAPTTHDLVLEIGPSAFRPPPQVESAVLHLRVRPAPCVPLADERRFHAVVRSAFAQRRKTLANALAAGLGLPLEVVRATARTAGVDPGRRAETLTIL